MNLDSDDVAILKVLFADGRASMREVAARTGLSTPTVSARVSRMVKGGLILGFEPVINPAAASRVEALVRARAPLKGLEKATAALGRIGGVSAVYATTGSENVTLRVSARSLEEVDRIVGGPVSSVKGVEVASKEIITRVAKDSKGVDVAEGMTLALKCDYCGAPVLSERPYNVKVGASTHYFCCRTCRRSYLTENREKLARARARVQTPLRA